MLYVGRAPSPLTTERTVSRRPPAVPSLIVASPRSPRRAELEAGVRATYASAYGATIRHFLPVLLGLHDDQGALLGVIGSQSGRDPGPMFLETYLDRPVEVELAAVVGEPVRRDELAEVGNLSALQPGAGLLLVSTLAAYLDGVGTRWSIFTATAPLRATFARRGLELADLGPADGRRLGERLADWGRYYATEPRVTASYVPTLRVAFARDERLAATCGAVWEAAFRRGRLDARDAA